jgi:uncharacterized protein YPO0396
VVLLLEETVLQESILPVMGKSLKRRTVEEVVDLLAVEARSIAAEVVVGLMELFVKILREMRTVLRDNTRDVIPLDGKPTSLL